MAKLISNPAIGELSGTIGDLVFARRKTGSVVVRERPVRTTEAKEGEIANQQVFSTAVVWAKAVWANQPELKARYKAAAQAVGRQGFHLAKADFLLPPKVEEIDLGAYSGNPGQMIRILAQDDFEVTEVALTVRDLAGSTIEGGPASKENGAWVYRAQTQVAAGQTVTIEVTAKDHPGHTAKKRVDHACGPRPA